MKQKVNKIFEAITFALFLVLSLAVCYSYYFETDPEIKATIFTATKILAVPFIVSLVIFAETCEIPEE